MKFKIGLFVITLFLVIQIQAQPQEYNGFGPFRICEYQSPNKIIFVGRVLSFERVETHLYNGGQVNSKVTIIVETAFNSKLKRQTEVFWDDHGVFVDLKKDDQRVFTAINSNLNGSEILISYGWSRKINNLSPSEKTILFSDIKSKVNRYPKSPILFGTVIEKYKSSSETSKEINDKFGYDTKNFKSVTGIIIEAKSEKDGAVFRTKTDKKGVFIFDSLIDGNYFIYPIHPKGYESSLDLFREYRLQNPNYQLLKYKIDKNTCNYGIVFEMRKASNS